MSDETFSQFSKRNGARVYNYILRMVRHREDAEDITQEVFLAVYEKYDGIIPEARDAYLFRAAYNKVVNYSKARGRSPEVQQETFEEPCQETDTDEEALQRTRNHNIREALARLNENERAAIDLKYFQKMDYRNIADVLDVTPAAVDSLLIRAKRKLKKIIAQDS